MDLSGIYTAKKWILYLHNDLRLKSRKALNNLFQTELKPVFHYADFAARNGAVIVFQKYKRQDRFSISKNQAPKRSS